MQVGDKVLCKKTYNSMSGGHKFQFKEGKWYEITDLGKGGYKITTGKYSGKISPYLRIEIVNKNKYVFMYPEIRQKCLD